MIRRIITTVGTSIIGNFKQENSESPRIKDFDQLENTSLKDWENHPKKIERCKLVLTKFLQKDKHKASAEVKSLGKIIAQYVQYPDDKIEIYLLATDTILSRMVAEVLEEYYRKNQTVYFLPDKHIIKGLQVKDAKNLGEHGFANLINVIEKIKVKNDEDDKKDKNEKKEIKLILNVTGGYKAIIPILTILGQVMDVPVNYIYEDSEALIEIEKMPIGIDWGLAEELAPYIDSSYIENTHPDSQAIVSNMSEIIPKLKKYKLIKDSDNPKLTYEITGWGYVFKGYVETNMSISYKNTTSHIVEYKMYEYFHNNPYKSDGITYAKPEVGIVMEKSNPTSENDHDGEIDIILYDNKKGEYDYDNYVAIEVKSIGMFLAKEGFKDVIKRLTKNKLTPFTNHFGKDPNEIHYIIFQMFNGVKKEALSGRMNTLKKIVQTHNPNIKFKAFLFTIGDPTDEKVYQNLFRRTITKDDLQEIQIP